MLNLFSEMAQGILGLLGEDAFLDGATTPIKINIEHGVQLTGMGGEEAAYRGALVAEKDVATILLSDNPQMGQRFTQNGKTYRLEAKVEDNGVTGRFIVLEMR